MKLLFSSFFLDIHQWFLSFATVVILILYCHVRVGDIAWPRNSINKYFVHLGLLYNKCSIKWSTIFYSLLTIRFKLHSYELILFKMQFTIPSINLYVINTPEYLTLKNKGKYFKGMEVVLLYNFDCFRRLYFMFILKHNIFFKNKLRNRERNYDMFP